MRQVPADTTLAKQCLRLTVIAAVTWLSGAASALPAQTDHPPARETFWSRLRTLCESAATGSLRQAPPGDTQIDPAAPLLVHFWQCSDSELRFPLHVAANRSRTWVFVRHADRLELRHDHRHEDGSEAERTWYGATTLDDGTPGRQEFVSETNGVRGGWAVEIEPGERFTYGTIRSGQWRHRLDFDLTSPVPAPPLHWGHAVRPSQRP